MEDFERLREDAGLAERLGHELPLPKAARTLLYASDDDKRTGQAQVNQKLVQAIGRPCTDQKTAMVHLRATVIESFTREAKPTSEGGKGYPPRLALWVEMDLALSDEFRDGNVPAHDEPLPTAKRPSQCCLGACGSIVFAGTRLAGTGRR